MCFVYVKQQHLAAIFRGDDGEEYLTSTKENTAATAVNDKKPKNKFQISWQEGIFFHFTAQVFLFTYEIHAIQLYVFHISPFFKQNYSKKRKGRQTSVSFCVCLCVFVSDKNHHINDRLLWKKV